MRIRCSCPSAAAEATSSTVLTVPKTLDVDPQAGRVELTTEAFAVVIGVSLLYAFYRAVEVQWPESYFPVSRSLDRAIAAGPLRYALFRFFPPVVVMTTIGGILANDGRAVVVPVASVGALHALMTSGLAIVQDLRHGTARTRPLVLAYRLIVAAACLLCIPLALLLATASRSVLPSTHEFGVSIWTAGLAAVLGGYVLSISRRAISQPDTNKAFRDSRRLIGDDLWELAATTAAAVGATPELVQGVLLVENLQRPRWVRSLERFGGRLVGVSSCGPLQVVARQPRGTDEEDLVRAIEERFAGQRVPRKRGQTGTEFDDPDWFQLFLDAYNEDREWQKDVRSAYQFVQRPSYPCIAKTTAVAPDGRPLVEVSAFAVDEAQLRIRGTVFGDVVTVQQRNRSDETLSIHRERVRTHRGRRAEWTSSLTIDPGVTGLLVSRDEAADPVTDAFRLPVAPPTTAVGPSG